MEENTESRENQDNQPETAGCEKKSAENTSTVKTRCSREFWCIMAAAFLGGFLAIYFVTDQALYRQYKRGFLLPPDRMHQRMIKDFDRFYENERRDFERSFGSFERDFERSFNGSFKNKKTNPFKLSEKWFSNDRHKEKRLKDEFNPFLFPDNPAEGAAIKTDIEPDKYKVIIDLKAFQGDESRINYNVSNRKLTVFGSSKVKEKNFEQDISFSQDFLLPYNADISKISRKKEDNKAVIEVPLKKK